MTDATNENRILNVEQEYEYSHFNRDAAKLGIYYNIRVIYLKIHKYTITIAGNEPSSLTSAYLNSPILHYCRVQ